MTRPADTLVPIAELMTLGPTHLLNFRMCRYHGDGMSSQFSELTSGDQDRAGALYRYLEKLFALLSQPAFDLSSPKFRSLLARYPLDDVAAIAVGFGPSSYAAHPSTLLAKTIHDIRGGGLTPLLGQLQLAQAYGARAIEREALYFLTRDHLKIMRNALIGLDDAKRERDFELKIHHTGLIAEKWADAELVQEGRRIRVRTLCAQSVPISECCVEFGALDRVLYNLINNAARHTAADWVELAFFPVPDAKGPNGRFVVLNRVKPDDLAYLRNRRLDTLFLEGTSTTGSGFGLAIASDFVFHAYGLSNPLEALKAGYLGAKLLDDLLTVWFHWPLVLKA